MDRFLSGLRQRGLTDPRMIISDAHGGIVAAVGRVFPTLPWQRCQFHFARNITAKAPAKYQAGLSSELTEMFNCRTIGEARKSGTRFSLTTKMSQSQPCSAWMKDLRVP